MPLALGTYAYKLEIIFNLQTVPTYTGLLFYQNKKVGRYPRTYNTFNLK